MEVCSSTEMGAPGASHLGTGDHGPKTDRSRPRSVPVNALVLTGLANFRVVGKLEVILGADLFGGQVVNALLYRFGS